MHIELTCAQCVWNSFGINEDHPNDALVYCTDCGREIGTMAELSVAAGMGDKLPLAGGQSCSARACK